MFFFPSTRAEGEKKNQLPFLGVMNNDVNKVNVTKSDVRNATIRSTRATWFFCIYSHLSKNIKYKLLAELRINDL